MVHPASVLSVAWSPDGTTLASASDDGTLRLWDPTTGKEVTPEPTPGSRVPGQWATLTRDRLSTEDLIGRGPLAGHIRGVLDVACADDGPEAHRGMVIGIDGRWGSGKTVLAHHALDRMLSPQAGAGAQLWRGQPVVVWFDAWRESKQSPHWWALASSLRRGIAVERDWATQVAMVLSLGLRRIRRSGAAVVVGIVLLLALAAWGRYGTTGSFDTAAKAAQAIGALVVAAYVVTRFLFWFSPTFGRLHERTDDNPLGEVVAMTRDLRRWSPRQGTPHRRDALLLAIVCLLLAGQTARLLSDDPAVLAALTTDGLSLTQWLPTMSVAVLAGALGGSLVVAVWPPSGGSTGSRTLRAAARPDPGPAQGRRVLPWLVGGGAALVVLATTWLPTRARYQELAPAWLRALTAPHWALALLTLTATVAITLFVWRLLSQAELPRRPVILVLDELDRCDPDVVRAYLETIQTLLRSPQLKPGSPLLPARWHQWRAPAPLAVLVLADGRWVRQSFTTSYKDFENLGSPGRSLGADFLQKLFDHTVLVPALTAEQAATMTDHVTRRPGVGPSAGRRVEPTALEAAGAPGQTQRPTLVPPPLDADGPHEEPTVPATPPVGHPGDPHNGTGADPVSPATSPREIDRATEQATRAAEAATSPQAMAATVSHLLTEHHGVMPANPRLIRRVANTWGMLDVLRKSLQTGVDDAVLARAAIFLVSFPSLVDALIDAVEPPETGRDADPRSPWLRRDVQAVLRLSDGTDIDSTTLAACYGHVFPDVPPARPAPPAAAPAAAGDTPEPST